MTEAFSKSHYEPGQVGLLQLESQVRVVHGDLRDDSLKIR